MTDERVFSRPQEFLCERWTTEPELVKDPSAFIPFNSGTHGHLGCSFPFSALPGVAVSKSIFGREF
jgi:cytochrome P450